MRPKVSEHAFEEEERERRKRRATRTKRSQPVSV
jgi:hypothetical protein